MSDPNFGWVFAIIGFLKMPILIRIEKLYQRLRNAFPKRSLQI
ncbi:hypothetical protein [Synechococcus sp. PCC 7502]|nr:hypothetical protein [Synechococcus sp. PCC 7502]